MLRLESEKTSSEAAMAEWLRRWTRNPVGYPRAGSNPACSVTSFLLIALARLSDYLNRIFSQH